MRIDVWDVKDHAVPAEALDCGYPRDFEQLFTVDRVVGKGGFGSVRVVVEKASGDTFACKSIQKRLDIPNISADKQAQHIDNVEREIAILKRLRGTLSVVHFKGAWEDDADIHIVMEYCSGGELLHTIGQRAYTEERAAGCMRSVLHTLAQCHSHRILHRDVKPGNFMLLNDREDSPLKAIDFGLAVFFDPDHLPRTDLGLDGTPWFMAPEVLSSQTFPASDLWAAGVMAYQLLSGYLPFDDHRNPNAPALSVVWKGILTEAPSFRRSAWADVSPEARAFVSALLNKDHAARPTAKEALKHPWLQTAFHTGKRRPLSATVVQRIQRFAQANVLRRTILELIANELLKTAPPHLSPDGVASSAFAADAADALAAHSSPQPIGGLEGASSSACTSPSVRDGDGSAHSGAVFFPMSPEKSSAMLGERGGAQPAADISRRGSLDGPFWRSTSMQGGHAMPRSPSMQALATLSRAAGRRSATVHGPADYWRVMRQASELAAMGSGHAQVGYLRAAPRSEQERSEQRKAARLSLDTSVHGGERYQALLQRLDHPHSKLAGGGMRASQSLGALHHPETASPPPPQPLFPREPPSQVAEPMDMDRLESGGRGRSAAFAALQAEGGDGGEEAGGAPAAADSPGKQPKKVSFMTSPFSSGEAQEEMPSPGTAAARHSAAVPIRAGHLPRQPPPPPPPPQQQQQQQQQQQVARSPGAAAPAPFIARADGSGRGGSVHGPITTPQELESLMQRMHFRTGQGLTREAMGAALRQLGYDLEPTEVDVLMDQMDLDADRLVQPSEFVASQLDWGALQASHAEAWLECARRAFADLDRASAGRLSVDDLVAALRAKLPPAEVDFAVEDALLEAGQADAEAIDFEGFLRMLRVGSLDSLDSLDQYDPRLRRSMDLDGSAHGGSLHGAHRLQTVPETNALTP